MFGSLEKVRFAGTAIFSMDEEDKIKAINYNSDVLIKPAGQQQNVEAANRSICNMLLVGR